VDVEAPDEQVHRHVDGVRAFESQFQLGVM
jgi:hypothetical protein